MRYTSILLSASVVYLTACSSNESSIQGPLPQAAVVATPEFRQAMSSLISPGFVGGNRVQTLNNGDEIFPAMLAGIRSAKRSVNFETYVFEEGKTPQAFAEAFAAKAREGVPVKVLLDAHGSMKSKQYHQMMRDAGVQVEIYHPLLGMKLRSANFRTHRKLLLIDGRVGFIGGVGIADEWNGDARSPEEWRDLHYRVEGPVVAQLQGAFNDNWLDTHHEVLQGSEYYPPLSAVGQIQAKAFFSAPQKGRSSVELMYHLAIASAQKEILIETPYFIPDATLIDALCSAAQRGVKVQIIMPGEHIDQKKVRRASKKTWKKLLTGGVRLYEYQPTMIHSKLLVVDGLFASIGSANFDPRSIRINDEANLSLLDRGFARTQVAVFQRDQRDCRALTLDEAGKIKPHEVPLQAVQKPVESQL